jgi:hypothetical protein
MTPRGYAFLLALGLLSACTSAPEPCIQYIECPDGPKDCREQAKELCPKGFKQLDESDIGPDFGDFEKEHFAGAASGAPHMLVTCNP